MSNTRTALSRRSFVAAAGIASAAALCAVDARTSEAEAV